MSLKNFTTCNVCPRDCAADRTSAILGYCESNHNISVSSVCIHHGEEPVISGTKGICNVFFSRCNLQCIYCQNFQISRNKGKVAEKKYSLMEIVNEIIQILDQGINMLGFVSPSHMVPQMKTIINALHQQKRFPVIVYNTNAYDKVDTIKSLKGLIDIYLPDLKYLDAVIAKEYSDAENYPEVASNSIKEMFRQKGTHLEMDENGNAISGLIIRHLVLPGNVENSISVLRFIANKLSPDVHLSLMSQYCPTPAVEKHPMLGRPIKKKEYDRVQDEMDELGFHRGWVQEMESTEFYNPDFTKKNPFENRK